MINKGLVIELCLYYGIITYCYFIFTESYFNKQRRLKDEKRN